MSDDERWRKMTPTERERNAVIIAEALQETFDRIADLEAQVTRLQVAVKHHASGRAIAMKHEQGLSVPEYVELEAALQQGAGLRPGDLDPLDDER